MIMGSALFLTRAPAPQNVCETEIKKQLLKAATHGDPLRGFPDMSLQ